MIAAQDGDRGAYEKLLLELLPHVRRQVARRVRDAHSREDIVQNVFVSLHRARHTYRGERAFAPWLYAIIRNASIDFARAQGRQSARELSLEAPGMQEPSIAPDDTADEGLSPALERALASLPATQREAVELIHLEELSVAEAAARAGVSAGALKVRAHRGYRALRALLGGGDT